VPLVSKFEDPDTGLAFDFLADPIPESPDGSKILAGHEHGLITITLAEANDAATAFGLRIAPNTGRAPKLAMEIEFDRCRQNDFDAGPGVCPSLYRSMARPCLPWGDESVAAVRPDVSDEVVWISTRVTARAASVLRHGARRTMAEHTLFVGLDVHKRTIAVATAPDVAGTLCTFYGTIANTPDALRRLCKKLAADGTALHFCYEAGPCGYVVQRRLSRLGHRCDVVAPTLIPRKAGDRVKNDRRDAMTLAQNLRAGHLVEVWVPDEAHEAMRDLVRMRALAKRDLRRARQQLQSFLLRHGLSYSGSSWSQAHRGWLADLSFVHPAQHLVLQEHVQRIERADELCARLNQAIVDLLPAWTLAPVVEALQALRGVSVVNAATLVAEIGCFGRFDHPRQLMAYLGWCPRSTRAARPSGAARSPRAATCWRGPAWWKPPGPTAFRPGSRVSSATARRTCRNRSELPPGRRRCGSPDVTASSWRQARWRRRWSRRSPGNCSASSGRSPRTVEPKTA
jgi:transposase